MVLQTKDKSNLNISDLKKPVQLYIPHDSNNGSAADVLNNTVHSFVKPSFDFNESKLIRYHKINIPHERDVVYVKLKPETLPSASLRVYVSFSDYPTPNEHNLSTVIPCKLGEPKCDKDRYIFSFHASDTGYTGIHYIGIHYYVNSSYDVMLREKGTRKSVNISVKYRPRRSREGGSRRQKRSCIDVKDPPPIPTPAPVVLRPEYNATTDLNYKLSVSIGNCFYWSEEKEHWTDEGCRVRITLLFIYLFIYLFVYFVIDELYFPCSQNSTVSHRSWLMLFPSTLFLQLGVYISTQTYMYIDGYRFAIHESVL